MIEYSLQILFCIRHSIRVMKLHYCLVLHPKQLILILNSMKQSLNSLVIQEMLLEQEVMRDFKLILQPD